MRTDFPIFHNWNLAANLTPQMSPFFCKNPMFNKFTLAYNSMLQTNLERNVDIKLHISLTKLHVGGKFNYIWWHVHYLVYIIQMQHNIPPIERTYQTLHVIFVLLHVSSIQSTWNAHKHIQQRLKFWTSSDIRKASKANKSHPYWFNFVVVLFYFFRLFCYVSCCWPFPWPIRWYLFKEENMGKMRACQQ